MIKKKYWITQTAGEILLIWTEISVTSVINIGLDKFYHKEDQYPSVNKVPIQPSYTMVLNNEGFNFEFLSKKICFISGLI